MFIFIASFPGLPLPLYHTHDQLGRMKERTKARSYRSALLLYRGVAKREVGEEGLGTRLLFLLFHFFTDILSSVYQVYIIREKSNLIQLKFFIRKKKNLSYANAQQCLL